jgi:hypothetical protein
MTGHLDPAVDAEPLAAIAVTGISAAQALAKDDFGGRHRPSPRASTRTFAEATWNPLVIG